MRSAIILSLSFHLLLFVECNPIINTQLGSLQGTTLTLKTGKTVDAYLGVPYAEAPTGTKRFLPPKTKEPWKDILVANKLPDSCYQFVPKQFEQIWDWSTSKSAMSEDCLYLNIWVPNPKPEKDMAVMVWIHGGGFFAGSSNIPLYDGSIYASEENVILVTINYRLNVFGFLNLEGTLANGNMGLMDQVEALKWINLNIGNFGGDPGKVTLFGEGTGGMAISSHIVSPSAKGLFNSAIIQSGPIPGTMEKLFPRENRKRKKIVFAQWINTFNCTYGENANDVLQCLKSIKPEILISHLHLKEEIQLAMHPAAVQDFFENDFQRQMKQKVLNKVNVIIGTSKEDGALTVPLLIGQQSESGLEFPTETESLNLVKELFPDEGEMIQDMIHSFYTDWNDPNDTIAIRLNMIHLATDFTVCDTNEFANHLSKAGIPVYLYQFSHVSSHSKFRKWLGSVHGGEVPFVFGRPLDHKDIYTYEEIEISKKMMHYGATFANYGNPNGKPNNKQPQIWPRYTLYGKKYIDLSTNISIKEGLRDRECSFWTRLFPEINRIAGSRKESAKCH